MTGNGIFQIAIFFLLFLAAAKPMGSYMAKVFAGERTFLYPVLRPIERLCYSACGVKESVEQRWTQYSGSLIAFSIFSVANGGAGLVLLGEELSDNARFDPSSRFVFVRPMDVAGTH